MPEYEALDLSALCNAGVALLGESARAAVGAQTFHGLPFLIGGQTGGQAGAAAGSAGDERACFIAFGAAESGLRAEPLTIPIGRTARRLVVAHRLLDADAERGGEPGRLVAEYLVHLASGETLRLPIRERFEIATVPTAWGGSPFLAVGDQKEGLHPRYEGRWGDAGQRQTEAFRPGARAYFLWTWANPQPEQAIVTLEVVPAGPRFLLAAITLGHVDEHPFVRSGTSEMKIVLPQAADAARPFGLEVEVDRGVATYPYALPERPADEFLADGFRGWGEPTNAKSSPAYVEVAAAPSATVTVKQGGEPLGSVRWAEVQEKKVVEPTPRLRVELLDRGRNWVHTTVLDDATGRPIPCRIHFRSPEGVPYQPHGHHGHVNSGLGTWHVDVGGDVRLGQITYAYIDGRCQGWLPRGEVLVDVARGFEYEPLRARVEIAPGQRELVLRLRRWRDMNAERWFSGDSHVHFLSTQGSHAEASGEDLNVVNLHQSQWGHLFTNTEEFTGRPSVSPDGRTIVYASQENRQHFLGHMILLGLREPIMPWCSDGPGEAELGGTLETTMADWADRCHAQGGTVILPHFPMPNGEPATLIATGRVDAVEMIRHGTFNHLEYYRYLNGGYRLPLVGGTDKMSSDVPVGTYRTYVQIPADQEFSYDNWRRHLAAGRTFLSGGPLLRFAVEGQGIGDTLTLPGGGGTLEVEAAADSILPIHALEIVQAGRVVAATSEPQGARSLRLRAKVQVAGHTWLAARVGGPGYDQVLPHHDVWSRGVFAHTSPVYVACGGEWAPFDLAVAQYMVTLIEGALAYVRERSPQRRPEAVTHHHGEADHLAYLERPFHQALAAIHRRLHQAGLGH